MCRDISFTASLFIHTLSNQHLMKSSRNKSHQRFKLLLLFSIRTLKHSDAGVVDVGDDELDPLPGV